jgi:hypothetical protein
MGQWSRAELAEALAHYETSVTKAVETGDWEHFVQLFAPDATYDEHVYGHFEGQDQIRAWVTRTMGTFPGNVMTSFPMKWSVIDTDRGWILCDVRNVMPDPGDGSVHEASNITILRYAGDLRFANEEDAYNPMNFLAMVKAWARVAREHGRLSDDGERWLSSMG